LDEPRGLASPSQVGRAYGVGAVAGIGFKSLFVLESYFELIETLKIHIYLNIAPKFMKSILLDS
jgi:hypothetical protein